jgi:hypothetical protein
MPACRLSIALSFSSNDCHHFVRDPGSLDVSEEYLFNVFGRIIAVARNSDAWVALRLGEEGKRRRAEFEIPSFIAAEELAQYLDDLFHEDATPSRPCVLQLREGRDR